MTARPRLLVLSHVLPFPGSRGQQQRVAYTLRAARERFHVTFATCVRSEQDIREKLSPFCDEVVFLPSEYSRSAARKAYHRAAGLLFTLRTGLRFSNYVIGRVEFAPASVAPLVAGRTFDCVLFEYWHAYQSIAVFRAKGIACVLDMHDILWQSYSRHLRDERRLPTWWKRRLVRRYKLREERAWKDFDGLIAINREEQAYVQARTAATSRTFYGPMGTDLSLWPYSWEPSRPPRVAYYGALGAAHNQDAALACATRIMPGIWTHYPAAELWLVGSDPPDHLRALCRDPRIKVTGFLQHVQEVLHTMSVVLCPWSGTYGFRSRLVEVMALGVPVVASPEAVSGMELEDSKGLLLANRASEMTALTLKLISDDSFAAEHSQLARRQVETLFSLDRTYRRLVAELCVWVERFSKEAA